MELVIFAINFHIPNIRYANKPDKMKTAKRILFLTVMLLFTAASYAQNDSYFFHTVKKGQTLYAISNMYNVTIEEITSLNPGSKVKISVGQKLRIPQKQYKPETGDSKKIEGNFHTIQQGETLYRICKMYGITVPELCAANNELKPNNLKVGEVIFIPDTKSSSAQTQPLKEVEKESKKTKKQKPATYKVKRGDTLESISEEFGITKQELIDANPELKNKKLKRNMVLNIPAPKKNEQLKKSDKELTNDEAYKQYLQYKDSINAIKKLQKGNDGITRVGVVLSFLLDSYAPSEQSRIVEYYQGFLIAVEQLKRQGYSFEINTFDAGHKEKGLDSLLASGALDKMNIIIGATYTKHNNQLADFAKKKEIPLVIPFASKEKNLYSNPMVYVVNSIQSYILPEVTAQFTRSFPNANVIFVEDTIKSDKKEFVNELSAELKKHGIPYTTVSMNSFTGSENAIPTLNELKAEGKDNIIIPTSSSSKTLNTILPVLVQSKIVDSTSVATYKLFGYPEWQIHAKETNGQMYEIDTYFYAPFYTHYSMPEAAKFQGEFIHWYNRNIQNIYPRYAMLGYDTGYYFLLASALHGNDMAEKINEVEFTPLQRGFKFERVNNWGGMVNKKFYFIHYTPDYRIERIDFDE